MCDKELKKYQSDNYYLNDILNELQNNVMRVRLAHELYTYAQRAKFYKYCNNISQILTVLIPVAILVCQNVECAYSGIVISCLSAAVAAISAISTALAFQKKWQHYRFYCETAKQELHMYLMAIGEYKSAADDEEREKMFAERIEAVFNDEKEDWKIIVKKKQQEESAATDQ